VRLRRDFLPHALVGFGLLLGLGVLIGFLLTGNGKRAAAPTETTAPAAPATTSAPPPAPASTAAPPPAPASTAAPPSTTAPSGLAFSQLAVTSLTPFSATISWQTTKPAVGHVAYGRADSEPSLWAPPTGPGTQLQATLSGLSFSTPYRAWVTAAAPDGQEVQTTVDFQTPPPGSPVASTAGSAVLLDGQPFFPLMVYGACPAYDGTLALGVNLFAATPSECGGLQTQLADLNGKALSAGSLTSDPILSGSGLIGWFYRDEADAAGAIPDALQPPPSGISFLTLTSHFYSGAAPLPQGRAMYPGLIAKAAVVGFDLYPLQGWCQANRLADVYAGQRELVALAPHRPTFQWIEDAKMRCDGPGLAVTAATVRAESFLAIAGGAHGLGFFPGQGWTGAAGAAIASVAHDVQALGPALLAPPAPATVEPGAGPVRVGARSYNGALYVIAVNSSRSPARATIGVPGLGGRSLAVLGESRQVEPKGDSFVDTFPSLGVHLYLAAPTG
jgi:hypothetical protein